MKPTDNFVLKEYPGGSVTQWFAENPAMYSRFGMKGHNGIDCVAPWDSPLYAIEDGVIVDVKRDADGFGRHLRLLSGGNLWVYGHCEQILVKPGQKVKAGEKIATMGNTGFVVSSQTATSWWGTVVKQTHPGTHLHLGLRKVKRDPKGFAYDVPDIKLKVLNYDNGYKGSIDPVPELKRILGEKPDLANLEKQITLLQKVVELYKLMLKK